MSTVNSREEVLRMWSTLCEGKREEGGREGGEGRREGGEGRREGGKEEREGGREGSIKLSTNY